jgi:hypothetical protein
MNTNDNFDSLWANLRNAVTEARTPKTVEPVRLKEITMQTTHPLDNVIAKSTIEVTEDSIQIYRAGALIKTYLTKEDAIRLAANLIAIHTK